jgi:hypothetical protein
MSRGKTADGDRALAPTVLVLVDEAQDLLHLPEADAA